MFNLREADKLMGLVMFKPITDPHFMKLFVIYFLFVIVLQLL